MKFLEREQLGGSVGEEDGAVGCPDAESIDIRQSMMSNT
jgi:hypothetical protein